MLFGDAAQHRAVEGHLASRREADVLEAEEEDHQSRGGGRCHYPVRSAPAAQAFGCRGLLRRLVERRSTGERGIELDNRLEAFGGLLLETSADYRIDPGRQ